jgi:cytochrome c553
MMFARAAVATVLWLGGGVSCGVAAETTPGAAPPGAASCSGCHAGQAGVDTPVPRLMGRDSAQLQDAMQAFRAGRRPATVMDRIAKGFSDDEIKAIAKWFAAQH